ncbi:hypothetical protein G7Y79_00053g088360 [Physcia stellaris]|nr:hypothetical protein G7Y79_00053g088360 [Physcia stellaris]
MLSAFTARPIVELKQRDKSKIEAVLAYGDRLLVGLNTGALRIYRVNEPIDETQAKNGTQPNEDHPRPQSSSKAADLLREQEKFSKYKIEQLAVVKEANLLISLSNNYIATHDLQTYELQETLLKTKGASTFAVTSNIVQDTSTSVNSIVSRLAVAIKRRLLLWSWHDSELASETSELPLATGIKTLTWITGTKLVAGLTSSYVLVDVGTLSVTDIVGPGAIGGAPGQDGGRLGGVGVASIGYMGLGGSAPKPLATRLGEGEVLLAKDINTLFMDTDGKSLGRRQVPWPFAPEAVGYSYPFLLALQSSKGTLEVRNPETLTLLQTVSLPGANQFHVPQPNVSLAHAGKGFLVLSERSIWRMGALDYDSQIDAIIDHGRLDEAISLLGMLEDALLKDKEGRLREIKMQKAQVLFDQRRYRDALDLFSEVSAPPERVIRLFPPVIAGTASILATDGKAHSGDQNHDVQGQADSEKTQKTSSVNSDGHEWSGVEGADEATKKEAEASVQPAIRKSTDEASTARHSKQRSSEDTESAAPLEGKDLKNATGELRGFLVSTRTRLQRHLNPDGSFKLEELTGDGTLSTDLRSELKPLVEEDYGASPSDWEQPLQAIAKLVDTTLFRAYMYASPSLAGPLFRIDNFCDPEVVNEKLLETNRYHDLVDFFYGKKLHRQALELLKKFGEAEKEDEAAPQLHGPRRTVIYLQSLPPEMIDLILDFARWPLDRDPELAMEIFLTDSENAETLPRAKVLDFLQSKDRRFAVKYLEHVIHELNDTTPGFHQRLADIYIEGLKVDEFKDDDERAKWKEKALAFLRDSRNYQAYKALNQLPSNDPHLYEARAIVLSNMGQHRQALDIYVFKLKDPEKAEEYCNQVYLKELAPPATPTQTRRTSTTEESKTSIYHTLLSLYLSPPAPQRPQWQPALRLLANHGARMPASSTLELIPEVLPIQDLESYFRGRIRSANTVMNESRIVAGMRSVLAVNQEASLRLGDDLPGGNKGRNRHVLITEDRVCAVCYKRFGGSVVKVLPNL